MKRSLMLTLAAIAGTAILAVALIGFRLSQGGLDYSAYAHIADLNGDTSIGPSTLGNPDDTHMEIDMKQDAGGTWCNPVDTTGAVVVGGQYKVALCLTTAPVAPAGIDAVLNFNPQLNQCVPAAACGSGTGDAACYDGNPDVNLGVTKFSGTDPAPNGLANNGTGGGWDCSQGGIAQLMPLCDNAAGAASFHCFTLAAGGLPVGNNVSEPVAVVTFNALAGGVDNLTLSGVTVIDPDTNTYLSCDQAKGCIGATDQKNTPEPATNTPTATATNTPVPPTATFTAVPGVRMEKSPANANLWLMKAGCVNPAEGKGCLVLTDKVFGIADVCDPNNVGCTTPEGLGAWETQIRFDHKFVSLTPVPDNTWLDSGGRLANCTMTILNENSILQGCVTKDNPANPGRLGPEGDGVIMTITVIPQYNDLIYRSDFRPTKDNGIVTDIVDDNCEVTDIFGEQIPGTLPGQLTTVCGDAHITIRMLEGDLNLDCQVTVLDDQAEAFRYGSQLGLQLYDRWFDLEPKWSDDDIDIKDLQFVFGRNYSTCQNPIPDDQAVPVPPPPDP